MRNPSAVLHGPRDVRIEERPGPRAGFGQVLMTIGATGICGSDAYHDEHGLIGGYVVTEPMVVGHESAGRIVAVGDGVEGARLGVLVALQPGVPCRHCEQCLRGRDNLCPEVVFFATPPVDGSIARYVVIDAAFAHPAPRGSTAAQAAMAEPVSVGIWAARRVGLTGRGRVLITGAGPIGLLAGHVARARAAAEVTLTNLHAFRLERAEQLGLRTARPDAPLASEFDVLLECSGARCALTDAMRALAAGGRVAVVGMGPDTVSIDVPLVQTRELSITGIYRHENTCPFALQLIGTGAVNVDDVITHRFGLEHAEDTLTVARRDRDALKAVVGAPTIREPAGQPADYLTTAMP